ncbi:hypothetical protein B5F33_01295 [Collinsella sp. An2]|nr:hypothetical protein B5F33_01295 [Collinsella sp. An2]
MPRKRREHATRAAADYPDARAGRPVHLGAEVRQVAAKAEGIGLRAMPEGLSGKMVCLST